MIKKTDIIISTNLIFNSKQFDIVLTNHDVLYVCKTIRYYPTLNRVMLAFEEAHIDKDKNIKIIYLK